MFKGYRDDGFALGLAVAFIISALVWFFATDYPINDGSENIENYQSSASSQAQHNSYEPEWGPWVRWLFKGEDTLAQWLMMFASFGAIVLLWRTLDQANKTNQAAVDAAKAANTANEIMRSEQRPWLVLERKIGCNFEEQDGFLRLEWEGRILNWGKSPAFSVRTHRSFGWISDFAAHPSDINKFIEDAVLAAGQNPTFLSLFPNEKQRFSKHHVMNRKRFEAGTRLFFHAISYRLTNAPDAELGFDVRCFTVAINNGSDPEIVGTHMLLEWQNLRQTT